MRYLLLLLVSIGCSSFPKYKSGDCMKVWEIREFKEQVGIADNGEKLYRTIFLDGGQYKVRCPKIEENDRQI